MRSRELNSLRLQLEYLLQRVERANDDHKRADDELHGIGLALKRLIDFTLPAQEKTNAQEMTKAQEKTDAQEKTGGK